MSCQFITGILAGFAVLGSVCALAFVMYRMGYEEARSQLLKGQHMAINEAILDTFETQFQDLKRSILAGERKIYPRHMIGPSAVSMDPTSSQEIDGDPITPNDDSQTEGVDFTPFFISLVIILASSLALCALRRKNGDASNQGNSQHDNQSSAQHASTPSMAAAADADIRQYEEHLQAMIAARRLVSAHSAAEADDSRSTAKFEAAPPPPPRGAAADTAAAAPLGGTCQYI